VIGNSPIAYALPAGRHYPVFLDVATSNVAFSKVMRAAEKGKKIPEGWLFDRNGKPTTDPSSPEATLAPFANHKGYGFAVFIEAISSVLANGKILGEVCQNGMEIAGNPFNVSHAFIVINAEMILGGAFRERMDRAIEEIIGSPKAEGSTRIYMPGEMEMEKKENAEIYGIDMPLDVYDQVRKLAESFEMDVSLCMKQ
jgi:ureidoglycolate dehydrogenase (NAD+)